MYLKRNKLFYFNSMFTLTWFIKVTISEPNILINASNLLRNLSQLKVGIFGNLEAHLCKTEIMCMEIVNTQNT